MPLASVRLPLNIFVFTGKHCLLHGDVWLRGLWVQCMNVIGWIVDTVEGEISGEIVGGWIVTIKAGEIGV